MNYENYDPSFPDQPVVDLYLSIWASLPAFRSKPAFIWAEDTASVTTKSSLTYAQLNDSVQTISSQLLLTLQSGDTVVILCPPGLELVETIFGCQRAGLLCVPIIPPDPCFAKGDYHHLLRVISQTNPKAAIAHRDYITRLRQYASSSSCNQRLAQMLRSLKWVSTTQIKDKRVVDSSSVASSYNGIKPDEVYLIQYTSGATGIPKPVVVTAGSAAHNVRTARKAYDLHPNSVIVSWLPQYHDCGLMFLLLTIVCGATCVLTSPNAFINRPRLWLELISEFEATCTPVPSFTLPLVVKRGGIDKGTSSINLWSLRNLIIINEPIYKSSIDEFIDVFRPFGLNPSSISPSYGLAENCTFVSTSWRPNFSNPASVQDIPSHNQLLPSARLAPKHEEEDMEMDMDIIVVNEQTLELVDDGIEGEIWVSSPSNANGYLGYPSLTREIFQARLSNRASRCYVRTSDRGVVKGQERFLFVTGRCLDIIKLPNNQEIHPHYIETTAYKSFPKSLRGGCIAAFEVPRRTIVIVGEMQRSEKNNGVLRRICEGIRRSVLEEEKVDVGLVVLVKTGCVPKTTSGKIQRWATKDKLISGKMSVLVEMRFENNNGFLLPNLGMVNGIKGKEEVRREDQKGGSERVEQREEIFLSFSSNPRRTPLLSLL